MPWTAEQKKDNRKVQKTHLKDAKPPPKTCEQGAQTEPPFLTEGAEVHVLRAFAQLCRATPAERLTCVRWDPASLTWRLIATEGIHKGKALWCDLPEEALKLAKPRSEKGPAPTDPGQKKNP